MTLYAAQYVHMVEMETLLLTLHNDSRCFMMNAIAPRNPFCLDQQGLQ